MTLFAWFMLGLALRPWTRSKLERVLIFGAPVLVFCLRGRQRIVVGVHFVTVMCWLDWRAAAAWP